MLDVEIIQTSFSAAHAKDSISLPGCTQSVLSSLTGSPFSTAACRYRESVFNLGKMCLLNEKLNKKQYAHSKHRHPLSSVVRIDPALSGAGGAGWLAALLEDSVAAAIEW